MWRLAIGLARLFVVAALVPLTGCATCGSDRLHWSVEAGGPASGPPSLTYMHRQTLSAMQNHVRYPLEACRAGLEGAPSVKVRISATGEIMEVALERSSGHTLLDQALIDGWSRASPDISRAPNWMNFGRGCGRSAGDIGCSGSHCCAMRC
jgi:TonB family protein